MTKEEMSKIVIAFDRVTDHVERQDGLRQLMQEFPEYREQILTEAASLEMPEDPAWYRSYLEQ